MNYPCNLIRDLIPLYIDDACSAESKEAVRAHLKECPACTAFCKTIHGEGAGEIQDDVNADQELKKAASFLEVKKKFFRRQIVAALGAVAALLLILSIGIGILNQIPDTISYRDNIFVSMNDHDLVGRLQGSSYSSIQIKNVAVPASSTEAHYLFFSITGSKWDRLTANPNVFSEFTLSYADKGADQVEAVYYYTGSLADLEEMDTSQLGQVINESVCLWKR